MNHTSKIDLSKSQSDTADFLRSIWPEGHTYCIAVKSPGKGGMRQTLFTSIEEAAAFAVHTSTQGYEAYHACAVFHDGSSRKAVNAAGAKAFWLDIDVGPDKPYADDRTALAALFAFTQRIGWPIPTVVHSGRGWHAYWPLTEMLPAAAWVPCAEAFKALCTRHGLAADPARTADIASILRPVGTLNYKRGTGVPVVLKHTAQPVSIRAIVPALQINAATPAFDNRKFEAKPKHSEAPSSASTIAANCKQLAHFRDTQGRMPEPLWYAGLCLLAHCEDGGGFAHEWSKGDERYIYADTARKLEHGRRDSGPTTCEKYQSLNAQGCVGCPHAGKITSPIQLGRKLAATTTLPLDVAAVVAELAKLSMVDYDRARDAASKQLGIRVGTLDEEVKKARGDHDGAANTSSDILFPEIIPWPDSVDGEQLLTEIAATFTMHIIMPPGAADALALWVLHTHAHEAATISPILAITSPTPECGKTNLLTILGALVAKPLATSNITTAALFRAVEKWRPTLMVDEADTFLKDNDELRGVLNSGHNRAVAYVLRTVGDDHEPRRFGTWAPKAIAMIGKLPATLESRAIPIPLQRKAPGQQVRSVRADRLEHLRSIVQRCARWAVDHLAELREADTSIPAKLTGRRADNWRPLLCIGDAAGAEWPERSRTAAAALTVTDAGQTTAITLLSDIRDILNERQADRISSFDLATILGTMEDKPWPDFSRGRPITQAQIARQLKPFKILSGSIRTIAGTPKGYYAEQFQDAFERYLGPEAATSPQLK